MGTDCDFVYLATLSPRRLAMVVVHRGFILYHLPDSFDIGQYGMQQWPLIQTFQCLSELSGTARTHDNAVLQVGF